MGLVLLTWCLTVAGPALAANEPHAVEFCKHPVAYARLAEGAVLFCFIREGMPMQQVHDILGWKCLFVITAGGEMDYYFSLGLTVQSTPLCPFPDAARVLKVWWIPELVNIEYSPPG
jgi:hypothetical protein